MEAVEGARPLRFIAAELVTGESSGFGPTDNNLYVVTNIIVSVQGPPNLIAVLDFNGIPFEIIETPAGPNTTTTFNEQVWIPLEPGDAINFTCTTAGSATWLAAGWSWPYAYPLAFTP